MFCYIGVRLVCLNRLYFEKIKELFAYDMLILYVTKLSWKSLFSFEGNSWPLPDTVKHYQRNPFFWKHWKHLSHNARLQCMVLACVVFWVYRRGADVSSWKLYRGVSQFITFDQSSWLNWDRLLIALGNIWSDCLCFVCLKLTLNYTINATIQCHM